MNGTYIFAQLGSPHQSRLIRIIEVVALLPLTSAMWHILKTALVGVWVQAQAEPFLLAMLSSLMGGGFVVGPATIKLILVAVAIYVVCLWVAVLLSDNTFVSQKPVAIAVQIGLVLGSLTMVSVMWIQRAQMDALFFSLGIFLLPLAVAVHQVERLRRLVVKGIAANKFRLYAISLALLALTTTIVMTTDSSPPHPVADPRLLEPMSDKELRAMADLAPPAAREGLYNALLASVKKSKTISDVPVEIRVGEYRYRIPMNYLTPYGNWKEQKKFDSFGFKTFLPDFRGLDRRNFIDSRHPDKVTVIWYDKQPAEAEEMLERSIKYKIIESSPSLEEYGLKGYKHNNAIWGEVDWIGQGNHGYTMFITCSHTAPNPGCKVEYHHKTNRYWLVYRYGAHHLPQWRDIDDGINRLLLQWREAANTHFSSTER